MLSCLEEFFEENGMRQSSLNHHLEPDDFRSLFQTEKTLSRNKNISDYKIQPDLESFLLTSTMWVTYFSVLHCCDNGHMWSPLIMTKLELDGDCHKQHCHQLAPLTDLFTTHTHTHTPATW